MLIIGVDYHPGFQQIAFLNQETGGCGEQRLNHSDGRELRHFFVQFLPIPDRVLTMPPGSLLRGSSVGSWKGLTLSPIRLQTPFQFLSVA
jgi:hypothetical protein